MIKINFWSEDIISMTFLLYTLKIADAQLDKDTTSPSS